MLAVKEQRRVEPRDPAMRGDPVIKVEILGVENVGAGERLHPVRDLAADHHGRPDERIFDPGKPADERRGRVDGIGHCRDIVADQLFRLRRDECDVGMCVEIRDLPREAFGAAQIVLIEPGDITATRMRDAEIARADGAAILLHRNKADARVGP